MMAPKSTHPVSIETLKKVVWKSSNLVLASITNIFDNDIIPAAARNQISSIGSEIAKQANQSNVNWTEVLVVVFSPNFDGNE